MTQPTAPKCLACGGQLEDGFIIDAAATSRAARWGRGQPEVGFFGGLTIADNQQLKTVTMRCVTCGFLMSFANAPAS